jgi:hypothetical protein
VPSLPTGGFGHVPMYRFERRPRARMRVESATWKRNAIAGHRFETWEALEALQRSLALHCEHVIFQAESGELRGCQHVEELARCSFVISRRSSLFHSRAI